MSRVQRFTLTYAANLALTGLTIVVGFAVTPALLLALGTERFGATRVAQDWFGSLFVLDASLLTGLLPLLAQAYSSSDADRLRRIFATGILAYAKLALGMVGVGAVLVAIIPWLVRVDPALSTDLRIGCAIGLITMLFVPLGMFRAMLESRQRGYLVHVMIGTQQVATSLLALAFAWLDWGITGQFAAALAGQALLGVMLAAEAWFSSRQMLREVRLVADAEVAGQLWKLNAHALIQSICGRLSLMSDSIIISAILGPAFVVPFVLTQRLIAFVQGQLLAIGNASWAALAELHAQRDMVRFNDRLIELTRIVVFAGVATLVPIVVHTGAFMTLWVGARHYAGLDVTVLSAVVALSLAVMSLWGWSIGATGNQPRLTKVVIPGTILNVVVSVTATYLEGVAGPLYGTLAANAVLYAWAYPLVMRELYGTPVGRLYLAVLVPLVAGVPFGALVAYTASVWPPQGWLSLALHLAAAPPVYLATAFWVVFSPVERAEWVARARGIVRRVFGR